MKALWILSTALLLGACGGEAAEEQAAAETAAATYRGQPVSHWLTAVESAEAADRQLAVEALAQIGPEQEGVLPALILALDDPDTDVRSRAATALQRFDTAAVPGLTALVADADPAVRGQAIAQLGRLGPEAASAVPTLVRALESPNWELRFRAAEALGAIGPEAEEAVPALEAAAAEDEDANVRAAAEAALQRIRPPAEG